MYGLGKREDYQISNKKVYFFNPLERKEAWLCNEINAIAKAVDSRGNLWGMVFQYYNLDGAQITVAVNRKLINTSGVKLAKVLSSYGLSIYPGYERHLASYLSVILREVKDKIELVKVSEIIMLEPYKRNHTDKILEE